MSAKETIAIVGAGHCGGRAAEWLRRLESEARIVLVGAEELRPYERPPLSKEVLTGDKTLDHCHLHAEDFLAEKEVEFLAGVSALALDPRGKSLSLSDGGQLAYDKLLLATGGRCRELPLPGIGLDGVHYLRTAGEAAAIAEWLQPGASLVVIGGGFIGLEVAASARQLGCSATVLETADRLLGRVLPPAASDAVARLHRENGVDLHLGVRPIAILGMDKVAAVELENGERIAADTVLIGVGITPETTLAEAAGLSIDNGIVTDAGCRTADESIYAAGDVACAFHPRYQSHIRLESWQNAEKQAETAARGLLGQSHENSAVPWVWSDQHGWNMQFSGETTAFDEVVQRGSLEAEAMLCFFLRDDVLVGAFSLGRGAKAAKDLRVSARLIDRDARPSKENLRDPDFNLKTLLKAG